MISKLEDEYRFKVDALDNLQKQRDNLSAFIRELITVYKIDPSLFTPEIWFDLINIPKSKSDSDSMMGILALRAVLRDEHSVESKKLEALNRKIFLNNIDVTLDKIKLLQKALGPKE